MRGRETKKESEQQIARERMERKREREEEIEGEKMERPREREKEKEGREGRGEYLNHVQFILFECIVSNKI